MSSHRSPKTKMPAYDAAKHRAFKDKARGIDCDSESELSDSDFMISSKDEPKMSKGDAARRRAFKDKARDIVYYEDPDDPEGLGSFEWSSKDEAMMLEYDAACAAAFASITAKYNTASRRARKDKVRGMDSKNETTRECNKPKYMNIPDQCWLLRD